jgi:hypothetical protein
MFIYIEDIVSGIYGASFKGASKNNHIVVAFVKVMTTTSNKARGLEGVSGPMMLPLMVSLAEQPIYEFNVLDGGVHVVVPKQIGVSSLKTHVIRAIRKGGYLVNINNLIGLN